MEWSYMLVQSTLLVLCLLGTHHVTQHQPLPYMDEIFHIPQAQKYCNASFSEWDPKITTLPGLYLFSIGLLKPLSLVLNGGLLQWCSVLNLRYINSFFMTGNFYLFYSISHLLNRNKPQEERELYAVIKSVGLSLMPLLCFFNFLYYTDPGALFFVVYAYYQHLRGNFALSAILGIISMIFRQTNIVWVFFMALCNVCKNMHRQGKIQRERLTAWNLITNAIPVLVINTFINSWSYAVVGLTAIAFVLWNGSVVVGDKSAHEVCFNPPQLGYFACFTLGLSVWFLVSKEKLKGFCSFIWHYKLIVLLALATCLALVHRYTQVHEYLLADNRHYTFYVWSKLFGKYELVRYLLVPLYIYLYWSVNDSLSHVNWMIRLSLGLCLCAALVPQKLMEFRYFVVPYTIIRLHMKNESVKSLLLEVTLYVCINLFTFYIFLYKPIFWYRVHEPQRIMW